jgi:hypothetical protein
MLCRGFKESSEKRLELKEVDSGAFRYVLELWCGGYDFQELDWDAMQQLACVADRFQISEVVAALEDSMVGTLIVEVCVEMLNWPLRITGHSSLWNSRFQRQCT